MPGWTKPGDFSATSLERELRQTLTLTPDTPLCIAYSGGLDSHALLHAAARLRDLAGWRISAIHIDHGLQPASPDWAEHCQRVCAALNVPLVIERVTVRDVRERGIEDAARRARYAAFARTLMPGQAMLTAHHADDQAETLLLQLLRGSGPHGLAGMPRSTPLGRGSLMRPLLAFDRDALRDYAVRERLDWVEDASNRDLTLGRGFLRARVMPVLAERWPQAARRLARAAAHHAQVAHLLDEVAEGDLATSAVGQALSLSALRALSRARRANVLRFWTRGRLGYPLPERALAEVLALLARPSRTGHAVIRWPGVELRRYRDRLALGVPDHAAVAWEEIWRPDSVLVIPGAGVRLRTRPATGEGLALARLEGKTLRVRLRHGGEVCRLPGREHRHKVKKLLQAAGIPPWERARLPFVYADDDLAAVGDRFVCEPYAARAGESGVVVLLEPV